MVEKANPPSLKISIPSRPTTPEVPDIEETAAMGSSLPDDENISPKDDTSTTAFGLEKNVRMTVGDNETGKAQMPVISFSELCNSPPTKFTVPTSPPPRAYHNWYDSEDQPQPEETVPPNLSDSSGLDDKNVKMNGNGDNDQTKKAQKMPVISFSEFCNSPPTKFTISNSPPYPRAYLWYDDSDDRPEEEKTAPTNVSDIPRGDNTTMDSLLDSYLLLQGADAAAPRSPSSDYSPKDEKTNDEEDSGSDDDWHDSLPGPYGVEDFLECLYDAYYLDEDMTSKIVG